MLCQLTLFLHLNLGASLFVAKKQRGDAISQLLCAFGYYCSEYTSLIQEAGSVRVFQGNGSRGTNGLCEPPVFTQSEHGQTYIPARARRFNQSRG